MTSQPKIPRHGSPRPRALPSHPASKDHAAPARGARRLTEVGPELRARLERGDIAARTLSEALAIDLAALFGHAFGRTGAAGAARIGEAAGQGYTARMVLAGAELAKLGPAALADALAHPSDSVRGFAAHALAQAAAAFDAPLRDRLTPLADDPHFAVREWAWLAARPHIAADPDRAIKLLAPWARSPRENLRRYASEATRPRGVWCRHIDAFKREPERALPVLDPLRADPSRYVQDSVGNWLNDAAKDQPTFVRGTVRRWLDDDDRDDASPTAYIARRALRSVGG